MTAATAVLDGSLRPAGISRANVDAVLLDLGNTLVSYYRGCDFGPILERCIAGCTQLLQAKGICVRAGDALARAQALNCERPDLRVWPLTERLSQIFCGGQEPLPEAVLEALSQRFLEPIFATGKLDPDAAPLLTQLRAMGLRLAIVSNTPWGSASGPWRDELSRRGLLDLVDESVFCADVGWRKPAPQIFQRALDRLGVTAGRALFVGDDLHWDIEGAAACGMQPVLLSPNAPPPGCLHIRCLPELLLPLMG